MNAIKMLRARVIAAAAIAWLLVSGPALAQKWMTAAPVPQGAEKVYGIPAGGKLYVFGGLALAWKPIGMVMEYDPQADTWKPLAPLPAARGSASARLPRRGAVGNIVDLESTVGNTALMRYATAAAVRPASA